MNHFDPSKMDATDPAQTPNNDGLPPDANEETIGEFSSESAKPANNALYLLLALVVVGAGVVLFMHMRAGPKVAVASPEAANAKVTINQFLSDGGKNITAMRELLKNTEKIVQQFLDYPSTNQVKLEDLKTNPFRFAPPKDAQDTSQADIAKHAAQEKEAAKKTAQSLKIQTILVSGKTKAAMINNTMYTEGQEINSLTIEKITPSSIIVSSGPNKFEIKIQK